MKFTLAVSIACGAAVVAAGPVKLRPRLQLVDLAPFEKGKMHMISLEEAKAMAAKSQPFNGTTPSPASKTAGTKAAAAADGPAAAAGTCNDVRVRREWRSLSDQERGAFIDAVVCLLNTPSGGMQGAQNRYDDLVSLHQQIAGSIHQVAQFLPWHRYYLHVYEELLQSQCSYTDVIPWWDELQDTGNFANSPLFVDQHFAPAALKNGDQGTCLSTSSRLGGMVAHLGPGDSISDHCVSRAVDESLTASVSSDFVNSCKSNANYDDFRKCIEFGPHAYGHNGIGAVMSDVDPSPADPVFFMHHSFVDYLWRSWQLGDAAGRTYQITGNSDASGNAISTDYGLSSMGIRDDVRVWDVMDTTGGYLCYRYDKD